MALTDDIREIIRRLKEGYDLGQDLKSKLEELERRLDEYGDSQAQSEPEAVFMARLLADFIEAMGDKMPPVVSDFIKLYGKALKSGVGFTVYLACIRYWMLRRQGASHEDAAGAANLSRENQVWCRTLWNLQHLPQVDPQSQPDPVPQVGGLPQPPADASEWRPEPPKPPVATSPEKERCCQGGGSTEAVEVDWGTLRITETGGNGFLGGALTLRHRCGISAYTLQLEILPGITNYFQIGTSAFSRHVEVTRTDTSVTLTLKTPVQLYVSDQDRRHLGMLRVLAVSNCFTTPDRTRNELSLIRP